MRIKVRTWNGTEFTDQEVDAIPSGTPGLVIHRSLNGVGLVLTHESTGLKAAEFPDGIFWCAQALGELGDWTGGLSGKLLTAARDVIGAYDALPGTCSAPREARETEWARGGISS